VIVWKREAYLCRPPMRISMVLLQFLWKLHVLLPPSAGRKRRNDNDKAAMTAYIATNLLLSLVGLSMSKHYINELAGVFFHTECHCFINVHGHLMCTPHYVKS